MDVAKFLAQPLVARVAVTTPSGPSVRPVWFLHEEGLFWWFTGSSYSRLGAFLDADDRAALVVDRCDLATGQVVAVTVTGRATVRPFDHDRAVRKLTKYLGADIDRWPERFQAVLADETAALVALEPRRAPRLRDLSFEPVDQ